MSQRNRFENLIVFKDNEERSILKKHKAKIQKEKKRARKRSQSLASSLDSGMEDGSTTSSTRSQKTITELYNDVKKDLEDLNLKLSEKGERDMENDFENFFLEMFHTLAFIDSEEQKRWEIIKNGYKENARYLLLRKPTVPRDWFKIERGFGQHVRVWHNDGSIHVTSRNGLKIVQRPWKRNGT